MRQLRIALCGKSGSGKTTVAAYLREAYGFVVCTTGARCREVAREFFGTESKTVLNQITDAFRSISADVWLRHALQTLQGTTRHVVIDSLRFREDGAYAHANGFEVWRIECVSPVRLRRLEARAQGYDVAVDEFHPVEHALDDFPFTRVLENSYVSKAGLWSVIDRHVQALQGMTGIGPFPVDAGHVGLR
jgi:dephospho-CoA kinase